METDFVNHASRWVLLVGLALASGCATAPPRLPPPAPPDGPIRGVLYSADGAGGYGYTTETVAHTIHEQRLELLVEPVNWSHGTGRMLADNCDWTNVREQGRRLAETVRATKRNSPRLPIYFLAHSAGSAVVLEAAGELPPDSIERIILLAPSVSPEYDLRPALSASRCGIDAFLSQSDWVTLGLGMRVLGTTDRRWTAASGKVGFRRPADSPGAFLYGRLHEHFWEPSDASTGHKGGHYGSYEPAFLKARVLPLLARPGSTETPTK